MEKTWKVIFKDGLIIKLDDEQAIAFKILLDSGFVERKIVLIEKLS